MNSENDSLNKSSKNLKNQTIKSKDLKTWQTFKKIRNKLTNLKMKLKTKIIKESVDESEIDKSKLCWRIFNNEIGRGQSDQLIPRLIVDGKKLNNEQEKLDALCKSFVLPYCANISQMLPPDNFNYTHIETLNQIHITENDVIKVINEMDMNKPAGSDGINPKFYKSCDSSIAPILTQLYNQMLAEEEVPELLKESIIFPLYKQKGSRSIVKNYRPISFICTASKILEKILYNQINHFVDNREKMNDQQHGFRRQTSTQSAILKFTDDIRTAGDNQEMVGAVYVDFKAAFDSIIHDIIIFKMRQLGINGNILNWFKSYFTNRLIKFKNHNVMSQPQILQRGTPQGRSLSEMIFAMYINDIPNILRHCKSIFYADDLVLYASGKTEAKIQNLLQSDIENLLEWCRINKMKVNISKTKIMLFRPIKFKCATGVIIIKLN